MMKMLLLKTLIQMEVQTGSHLCRWLWPGNRTFSEVYIMVVSWWIVAFLHSEKCQQSSQESACFAAAGSWFLHALHWNLLTPNHN